MPPEQLSKYRLLEEVGQGGMAVVYRALDTALDREVAVKILHSHLAEDQESRRRFQREAHAVAKLKHPNILEIYDYSGIESERSFIVTEFIHGKTLREFLRRHPVSHPEIAVMIILEVCGALAHAHKLGIIHRDIKPENIMIRDDGVVKLTDFGIAQVVDVQRLTVTGQLLGSPAYMAPELVDGKRVDFRTDVYSAGTLLYQLATGELPFKGSNPHELLKRISEGIYPDPEMVNPVVGSKLSRIIRKALARDPDARYLTIKALAEALNGFLADVDLTEPARELAAYFRDPGAYSRKLQDRVVSALTRRGREALARRRIPEALAHFNRVLCVDPANREVLELLRTISRRQHVMRGLAAVLLSVALIGGAYALSTVWPWYDPSPVAGDSGGVPSGPVPGMADARTARIAAADRGPHRAGDRTLPDAARGVGARAAPDLRGGTDRQRVPQKRVIPVHEPVKLQRFFSRKVEVIPTPKAVTIWLNGRKLGDYGPDLREVELPTRRPAHLEFRNDACCYAWKTTIRPGAKIQGPLRPKLPWKPAQLRVVVEPAEARADVLVGRQVFRAGEPIPVPIPSYSQNGRTEVEVQVVARDYLPRTVKVEVAANQPLRQVVRLRRAP